MVPTFMRYNRRMNVSVEPGTYVLAVSGGVDSMVLLDVMRKLPHVEIVVAHYDHGIREDSGVDRLFVERITARHNLPFFYEQGMLGATASEATARTARYNFLKRIRTQTNAQAIVTAHHQDDVIETAILNVLRGTGRKGLSSLMDTDMYRRPFLGVTKQQIIGYAHAHHVHWREDSTNTNDAYLRNYVRLRIVPRLSNQARVQLLAHIQAAQTVNPVIDTLLLQDVQTHGQEGGLDRRWFTELPYDVSCEVMAAWLRQQGIRGFDNPLINRLVVQAKVAVPGKHIDINAGYFLDIGKGRLRLTPRTASP